MRGRLTVKLRGRTEAPALGAEGAQFLSARGAKQEAPHGPLQRLLGGPLPDRAAVFMSAEDKEMVSHDIIVAGRNKAFKDAIVVAVSA